MSEIPNVTEAEFAILECLWDSGSCTKRNIASSLYAKCTESELATVQKLLQRLEKKGLVSRDREGNAHSFSAVFSRQDFASGRMREVADRVTGGSLAPFVLHLIEGKHLTKRERDKIREVLNEVDPPKRGRKS